MGIGHFFKETNRELKGKKTLYLLVIIMPVLVLGEVLLPFFKWLAEKILAIHGIPYLAHSTMSMFLKHPTAILLLLILAVIVLLAVFSVFSFTLIGMKQVRNDAFSLFASIKETGETVIKYGVKSIPGLVFYFILLMPTIGFAFHSDIFAKIDIPDFISEYLFSNIYFLLLFVAGYVVLFILGLIRIHTLPLMILEKLTIAEAFKKSGQLTKGKKKAIFIKLMLILLISSLGTSLCGTIFYHLQIFIDAGNTNALFWGVVNLSLIKLASVFFSLFSTIFLLFLIIPPQDLGAQNEDRIHSGHKKGHKIAVAIAAVLFIVFLGSQIVLSIYDILVPYYNDIKIISHRGVDIDCGNGVQNLTSTMLKTHETSDPYYCEMDIQETKDLQFIVFHDPSLKNLCGVEGTPHDYTLEELQTFTASENGFSGKLSSFDEYLQAADEVGQKLLIEIKSSPADSPDLVDRFIRQYGDDILEHGHIIHAMGYPVIQALAGGFAADQTQPVEAVQSYAAKLQTDAASAERKNPFFVGAIVPYNLIYAGTGGAGITVEETFVDEHLLHSAYELGQEVYVWTVNDETIMKQMIYLGVDGIITDRPYAAREILKQFTEDTPCADRIGFYLDSIKPY